jgi:low affinity Fe/Cu permease
MDVDRHVRRVAARAPGVVGSPWAFLGSAVVTAAWFAAGPLFGWSSTWILVPATATSVGAFLLVLLLQYTQNRDTRAIQLKLNELIRALEAARTDLVRLDQLPDHEVDAIEREFRELE